MKKNTIYITITGLLLILTIIYVKNYTMTNNIVKNEVTLDNERQYFSNTISKHSKNIPITNENKF